jgi:predicted aldo/keto reductase-like oxidoreductase
MTHCDRTETSACDCHGVHDASNEIHFDRRALLRGAAAALAATGFGAAALAEQQDSPNGVPTRPLGKTGVRIPIVGLGGYHMGINDEKQATALMHAAIDEGMTFFDNSWDYHMGGSEEKMGKALAIGGRRQKVFVMTKVCGRDYKTCQEHLEDSLRRLQTDTIDLWQFHEINWDVDSEWLVDRGALRCAMEARKAGKVRFIGFTGHKDPSHLSKMLGVDFAWDTVQMPINVLDAQFRSFQQQVVPECNKRKIGVIGMKGLGGGLLVTKVGLAADVCRRFALSLPISTLVCGIRNLEELKQDVTMARNFKPMAADEIEKLLAETKEPAKAGEFEIFKTTRYGSPYHFKQHGE